MDVGRLRAHQWLWVGLILSWFSSFGRAAGYSALLKDLSATHPSCNGAFQLDVSREFFVEIANPIPGVQSYNELVRLYRAGSFENFDKQLHTFKKSYEDSPLREPATFLAAQSYFERARVGANEKTDSFLNEEFQKASLLYPKSVYLPVLILTAANYWMHTRDVERAIGLYELGKRKFRGGRLECVFELGSGEGLWFLGKKIDALKNFAQVAKKCKNRRVRTGALLRQADRARELGKKEAVEMYRETIQGNANVVTEHYPEAYFQAAELSFSKKNWKSARFYFGEYLNSPHPRECIGLAKKRMADIGFQIGESNKKVAGKYLEVAESQPATDVGRISQVFGLLIDAPKISNVEFERRVRLLDKTMKAIKDRQFRETAYLVKGLAAAERGEPDINYLVHFDEKSLVDLKKGEVGRYLSSAVEKYVSESLNKESLSRENLKLLEKGTKHWLTKSKIAAQFHMQITAKHLKNYLSKNRFDEGLSYLRERKRKGPWKPASLGKTARTQVAVGLAEFLSQSSEKPRVALGLTKNWKLVSSLTGAPVWFELLVAEEAGDQKKVDRLVKKTSTKKLSGELPKKTTLASGLWWIYANSAERIKNKGKAEYAYSQIKDKDLEKKGSDRLLALYSGSKDYLSAYKLAKKKFQTAAKSDKTRYYRELASVLEKGSLWKQLNDFEALGEGLELTDKEKGQFKFLAGKGYFERKNCKASQPRLQASVLSDPKGTFIAEARYKLGKCLLTSGKKELALQTWRELSEMKDSFWSPLADNEIKLNSIQ